MVSLASWPQSSEASDPGESELGTICIDFSDLVLELTQHRFYAFLLLQAVQRLCPRPRTYSWWEMWQRICGHGVKTTTLSCSALPSISALASNLPACHGSLTRVFPKEGSLMAPGGSTSLLCPSSFRGVQFSPPQVPSCEGLCPLWTSTPDICPAAPPPNGLSEDRQGHRSQVSKVQGSSVGLRDGQDGWRALIRGLEVRLGLQATGRVWSSSQEHYGKPLKRQSSHDHLLGKW